ncbi:zinc finger protein 184-like isoform X2 [Phymastichus coffea]|uniref:zinc finger protein 184-like isoform X2 n=1 Tax=Phymastichus coffea TaxID=108790 RepID=UPI00273CD262|nr:zinc finger protein 184-like isoform X2 [Phymastichus coffea]
MCARLLACPLCSQPGFLTLDSLRAGLVSVSTRPLACPVCNEVLLGIDKLTIHLFGHTVSSGNTPVGGGNESAKLIENANNAQIVRSAIQSWNVLDANNVQVKDTSRDNTGSGIYIPIDEIETFRNLTTIKDGSGMIPNGAQNGPSQVIFLQNVGSQPKLFSADLMEPIVKPHEQASLYQTIQAATGVACNGMAEPNASADLIELGAPSRAAELEQQQSARVSLPSDECRSLRFLDEGAISLFQASWREGAKPSESSPAFPQRSHTDRLEELVKSAQISSSPLGTFHEAYDCSRPASPKAAEATATSSGKPVVKSTQILAAGERMERCNVCGISFPGRNVLILHKQLVHMIKEKDASVSPDDLMKNYPCHLCTKVFKMRGSLMVHMRVAHPGVHVPRASKPAPKPIQEPTQEPIPEPIQNDEPASDEPEGNYICPTCGKSFKKEHQVTQHIKIHDTKQFECDICSKMFTTKYFLKKHKRLHSGEMPYKCNICDKTFTFQQSYHKHRLYHKDDKPHTCNTCGRSFKELSTLHNHERIHTGEKPFSCETCGKCFRQRVSYLVHRRIHTGAMPYECLACGKSFRYKVSQRTHKCPMQPQDGSEQRSGEASQASLDNDNFEMRDTLEMSSQDEHSMDDSVTSEDNQYILVLGNDGQHVLKKKTEVGNESNQTSTSEQTAKQTNQQANGESHAVMSNMWSEEQPHRMEFKEDSCSKSEDATENANLWGESFNTKNVNQHENSNELWSQIAKRNASAEKPFDKNDSSNTRDFLSMILDNEMTTPSAEMEHLRLSSPVNSSENNSSETKDCFPPMNSSASAVQVDHHHRADETFSSSNLSTLQTINEDSLKELLNSIADK